MLDEKRVKHMVKLALYESKDGAEELKTSSYYKKDFISFHTWWAIIWTTIAYIVLVLLLALAFMKTLAAGLSYVLILSLAAGIVAGYVLALIVCISVARKYYKKKHARAYHRVKRFKEGLNVLEDMYREEKNHG